MKTKKLFLMAAMLLTSVCTFAQNSTPLKGDVNEDGTVDVADLVSIMKIMKDAGGAVGEKMFYWYAGVNGGNAVTGDNFTNVASRIAESQIPKTGSVKASGQYVYIVMPERRHITSLTNANGAAVEYDCVDAFGYHIYKTSERVNGTFNYATAETIYYWYVGQTDPSTMTSISPIVTDNSSPGWREIGNSLPEYSSSNKLWSGGSDGTDINMGSFSTSYLALPSNTIKVYSVGTDLTNDSYTMYNEPIEIDGVNYYIYTSKSNFKYFRFDLY